MKNLFTFLLVISCLVSFSQVTPEQFAKGKTIGYGMVHTIQSAGFSATSFPRTNARYGVALDISKMTLDWACIQEAMFCMEDSAYTEFHFAPGKYYYTNHSIKLPLVAKSNGRSALLMWAFDLHHSAVRNNSSTDFAVFSRYPKDQTEAMQYLSYSYEFRNGLIRGNGNKTDQNIGILLGAVTCPVLENLRLDNCGIGAKMEFDLYSTIRQVKVTGYGIYGLVLQNGKWSGAANSNAQSNVTSIESFKAYNTPGGTPIAAIYFSGNHTLRGDVLSFEGDKNAQSHIFYENTGSTGVNVMELSNIYMEYAGCSKAAIRIRATKGQFIFNQFRSSVVETDMPCLIEVEAVSVSGNWGALHVFVNNTTTDTNKGKFRNIGNPAYGVNWYVTNYNMKNNTTFNSVENFDTTVPGSYLPKSTDCRFVKPL